MDRLNVNSTDSHLSSVTRVVAGNATVIPADPGWKVTTVYGEGEGLDEDGQPLRGTLTFPVAAWLDDGDHRIPMIFDSSVGLVVVRYPNLGRIVALTPPGGAEPVVDVNDSVRGGIAQPAPKEGTSSATERYMQAAERVPDDAGNAVSLVAVMHAYDVLLAKTEDAEMRAAGLGAEGHEAVAAMLEPADAQLLLVREWMYRAIALPASQRASAIATLVEQRPGRDQVPDFDPGCFEKPTMPSREAFLRTLDVLRGEARSDALANEGQKLLDQVCAWLAECHGRFCVGDFGPSPTANSERRGERR